MGGNLRLKIDWASLIVERKFIIFALFSFVFESNFPISSNQGAYIWGGGGGRFKGGFFKLPVWGTYIWRGLFSDFYSIQTNNMISFPSLAGQKKK